MAESITNFIKKIIELIFGHLPDPSGVLYFPPNLDGSRKKCSNCFMWSKDKKCLIHNKQLEISPDSVCGYHVPGIPLEKYVDRGIQIIDPKLSGLITVPSGSSCDLCIWFENNTCLAVKGFDGKPAKVQPLGCCARWQNK